MSNAANFPDVNQSSLNLLSKDSPGEEQNRKIDLLMKIFRQTNFNTSSDDNSVEPRKKILRSYQSVDVHSTRSNNSANNPQHTHQFYDTSNNQDWFNGILKSCVQTLESGSDNDSQDEADKTEDEQIRNEIRKLKKQQKNETFLKRKLEAKTNITNGEIILMCMLLGMRHSLSWEAILDIIELINALFEEDVLDLSKYKLVNYFSDNQNWYVYHVYCPVCKSYIGKREELKVPVECSSCKKAVPDIKKAPYFLTLDADSQLKEIFENPLIQPHLQYKYNRKKINPDNIEDIPDGLLHKLKSAEGEILHEKWNYSFTFNCDGCKAMDSSPLTIWPVYLKVNEFPPHIRNKYMIMVGLWADYVKPPMNTLLKPVVDKFNQLSSTGITWNLNGTQITSKFIPLICSVDSPCRCSMLNMKQYNGFFGCTFCYHPTTSVNKQRKFTFDETVPPLRTHEEICQAMKDSRVINKRTKQIEAREIKGVKGPSILMILNHWNMVDGMSVEALHAMFAGISYQYTDSVLTDVGKPYYVGTPDKVALINQRLLSVKVPGVITRQPQALELRTIWKASQWRSWSQNHSLPCLEGILPDEYLIHYSKLVIAVNILLQESISPEDLNLAHKLSIEFVQKFQEDFGKHQMTYNVHLLLHAVRSVRYLGPLHVHDAFCFENENRLILNLRTGPTEVAVQIAKRYMFYRQIPRFSTFFPIGPRVMKFSEHFSQRIKSCIEVNKTYLIGTGQVHIFDAAEQQLGFHGEVLKYQRMIHKNVRYTIASYSENLKINDSIIETVHGIKGIIISIYCRKAGSLDEIIIFYNQLVTKENLHKIEHLNHIQEYSVCDHLRYCHPNDLKKQCIVYEIGEKKYLCNIAKGCTGD